MNWEASARDAEGKHCSTGISSQNGPAMSPSSALATLEFERSSIFVNLIPLARLKLLSPGLSCRICREACASRSRTPLALGARDGQP
jgi:hypothetical protein